MTTVMVQLARGYGDGYGIVNVTESGDVVATTPTAHDGWYRDAGGAKVSRMEEWRRKLLSTPYVSLNDGGVRVPSTAVVRVLDQSEANRVRAKRYTKNWSDAAFVDAATDDELASAMSAEGEQNFYAAMSALRRKYATD